jgi:sugar transferase (PEP-CTERM system associated)
MIAPFSRRTALIALLELVLVATVFSTAFLVVASSHHPSLQQHMPWALAAHLTFALSLLLPASACRLHRPRHDEAMWSFLGKFLLSMTLGAALCYALFTLFPPIAPYATSIPHAVVMGAIGLAALRVFLSSSTQFGALCHRVLVLGTGAEAAAVDDALNRFTDRGITVVGFYQTSATDAVNVSSKRVIAPSEPLHQAIERLRVHEIVVAMREQRGGKIPLKDLLSCRLQGVAVTDLTAVFERVSGAVRVESLKASWLIYGNGFQQGWVRRTVKRAFDVAAATALLVASAPIMLAAAVAIFLESGRPILLRQERIGLGRRAFPLLKFRSMRIDAERDGVPRWAVASDPRVTRIGRVMRATRIDELPQIFNILRGEMSFVGPRPERPFFVAQLTEQLPFYTVRHTVKPGLTGWAQVQYRYGASVEDAMHKLEYDLYYVKNHSLLLDLIVLLRTVRVVVLGEGAR